ncbi:hypothetical protein GRX66_18245, partial [Halobacterium sp. PCN9]|nr:hypothetical protein [Halobacterium bonnevillei]
MIQWDETSTGVFATDAAENEVRVRAPDWQSAADARVLPQLTDAETTGVTSAFSVPADDATLASPETTASTTLAAGERQQLAAGDYVLEADGAIDVVVGFSGPAQVVLDDRLRVSFDAPERVAVGFRSDARAPPATITIPKTLDGVATAVTHAAAAHRTTTPDRSDPGFRRHPPAFAFGETVDVPPSVAAATPRHRHRTRRAALAAGAVRRRAPRLLPGCDSDSRRRRDAPAPCPGTLASTTPSTRSTWKPRRCSRASLA